MNNKIMAEKLRKLRGNRSRQEVAEACGISVSALAMYEAGKRVPRDEIKIKLAKFYNRSVNYIFFYQLSARVVLDLRRTHTWEERTDSASRSPSSAARPAPICNR